MDDGKGMKALELDEKNLHICLYSVDRMHKLTIAYFRKYKDGYELTFVDDRPLDKRVKWKRFRRLIEQGQKIADARFAKETEDQL